MYISVDQNGVITGAVVIKAFDEYKVQWLRSHIALGEIIYQGDQYIVTRYAGHKLPDYILSKLPLVVTTLLEKIA